jgi:CMP-N,N'-diacetyllegionaminic acid synthase
MGTTSILIRNKKLAQDHVQTDEVFLDMLRTIEVSKGFSTPKYLCLLQPTSPLRTAAHIDAMYEQWNKQGSIFSAIRRTGFFWHEMNGKDVPEPINGNPMTRLGGQWIPPYQKTVYQENGAIYMVETEQFSLYRSYRLAPYSVFPMSEEDSVDIDTHEDWMKAKDLLWKKN